MAAGCAPGDPCPLCTQALPAGFAPTPVRDLDAAEAALTDARAARDAAATAHRTAAAAAHTAERDLDAAHHRADLAATAADAATTALRTTLVAHEDLVRQVADDAPGVPVTSE